MCLPPANARIWPNPLLYSAVYHRYSLKSFQLCKSAQTYWYRKYFEHIVARFRGDSSCLTIDNIKPEHCPNSAPLYNPMSVVDNSAPLFFYSSHFNCNNNKFNPLSRVLNKNINKIYKMQHFTTLGNAAYKFFKTFRANPRGQSVSAVTGRIEYFRKDRQHTCTISFPERLCARSQRDCVLRTFSWEILVVGLSHHLMTTPNSTISEGKKLVEIQEILHQYHSNPMGRHSGINNTLSKISQYYMWNGMKEDVVEYVSMISDT